MIERHDPPSITPADIDGDFLPTDLPWDGLVDTVEGMYSLAEQLRQSNNLLTRRSDPANLMKVVVPLVTGAGGTLFDNDALGIRGPTVPEGEYWMIERINTHPAANAWHGYIVRNNDGSGSLGYGQRQGLILNIVADFQFLVNNTNDKSPGLGISNTAILEPGDTMRITDDGFSHGLNLTSFLILFIRREKA